MPDPTETSAPREPIRFLVFAASLKARSLNARLAERAATILQDHGGTVDLGTMAEFATPSYSQDVQDGEGFPAGAEALRRRIEASDAFVIASPEYNGSMPGLLKNTIDWLSRFKPQPLNGRHALLLSASPSMVGGNRGLWALRVPLEHLGVRVYPDMFSLAQAHKAWNDAGNLADEALGKRLERTLVDFMDLAEAAKHYPCAKAWIEFLGERPDPELEPVDQE